MAMIVPTWDAANLIMEVQQTGDFESLHQGTVEARIKGSNQFITKEIDNSVHKNYLDSPSLQMIEFL